MTATRRPVAGAGSEPDDIECDICMLILKYAEAYLAKNATEVRVRIFRVRPTCGRGWTRSVCERVHTVVPLLHVIIAYSTECVCRLRLKHFWIKCVTSFQLARVR